MKKHIVQFVRSTVVSAILIVTIAIGVCSAAFQEDRADAIKALESAGAVLTPDYDKRTNTTNVVGCEFHNVRDRNAAQVISQAKVLTHLKMLEISGTGFRDEDLAQPFQFKELKSLKILDVDLSDRSIQWIDQSPQLETLMFQGKMHNETLKLIAACKNLKAIHLVNPSLEPGAFGILSDMESLNELWVSQTTISDSDASSLSATPNLKSLGLLKCKISTAGLKDIAKLQHLKSLYLSDTPFDDADVMLLSGLRLEKIEIYGGQLTHSGFKKLRSTFPPAKIRVHPEPLKR